MKECYAAFLIVRRNANLFINLLNMMLSTGKGAELGLCCRVRRPVTHNLLYCATGIPELKTHKDVAYLKETLFLDRSEEEALKAFKEEVRTWGCPLGYAIMMLNFV